MRLAILSDIHGNDVALRAVLEDVRQLIPAPDRMVVLGDLVFKGAQPQACVDAVRALQCPVVQGNIDELVGTNRIQPGFARDEAHAAVLQQEMDWTRSVMSAENLAYLAGLPLMHTERIGGFHLRCVHATPQNVLDVMLPVMPDDAWGRMFEANPQDGSVPDAVVYGHIHLPFVRWFGGKLVINPGSIGLPFDGDARASYAVLDLHGGKVTAVTHRKVTYDLDEAVRAYDGTGHPQAASVIHAIRNGVRPL